MFTHNLPATTLGVLPFLFNHCFLSLLLLQHAQGELQKSCSRTSAEPVEGVCKLPCQCKRYPPLPPPPPPPPPPRLLSPTVAPATVPPMKPWGREVEILVLGTVICASVVFLLLTGIICYKAIKRKPLRKEENGTSRGEYAMSSRCTQQVVETNNTGV
ncbi:proline-rich membrane anchor 1 [Astyanax mexicanus]|uniref:Proline-rich membrane anchor 1-like n=2 Tax=Astyanax mexicanus TaxID=7994 RepID=A0A8B9HEI7_ASTMX|nr:proline-rich membrane anchor 1 [Astyanax mexicanus]KAG9282973.1 proline-rich membrane anchor 1-like [Astyanax mexicanus]